MNNGRWTPEEEKYIRDNAGKLTLSEMAAFVGRSELAVQLFMHRRKIVIRQVVKRNLVQEILSLKFKHPENFMPNRPFYKEVGINQMRFWDYTMGVNPSQMKNISRSVIISGLHSKKPSKRAS